MRILLSVAACLVAAPALAQWEPDIRLTENDSASSVSIVAARALAAEGDFIHAVWHDDCDQYPEVRVFYARSSDRGLTWSSAAALPEDTTGSAEASVAVAGGRVHVVWLGTSGGLPVLFYKSSSDSGATWSGDRWLTGNAQFYSTPCLAVSGPTLHLVWTGGTYDTMRVLHKRSPDCGVSWGPDIVVSTNDSGAAYGSVCAEDSLVHVAWSGLVADNRSEAFYRRSTDRGLTWQPTVQLTGGSVGTSSVLPQVAASGELVHIACIIRPVDKHEAVYLRSPDRGQSWGAAHRMFSTPGEDVGRATVVADDGTVHFAATLVDSGPTRVHYQLSTDGGLQWEVSGRLSDTGPADKVSLALAGNAVYALWRDSRDGNQEVYFKRNPTGNPGIAEEGRTPDAGRLPPRATIVRGVLNLPRDMTGFGPAKSDRVPRPALLDASGRRVMELQPGANDVSRLAPGVYFIRAGNAPPLRRVLLVR
ncbi:exo-alpha-sialidase [candidate division WOR-3 bacterium]|nr:exo-alpha-sialidase [candidate division WOR-3 bacterium]